MESNPRESRPDGPGRTAHWIVLGNLLVASVLVLATLISLHGSREEELDRVRETADNLANGLSIELAAEIRLVDNALTTISSRYTADAIDATGREQALLRSMREQNQLLPFARALRAAGPDGRVTLGLAPGEQIFSIADRDYFQRARRGHATVISEPVFSRAFEDWCIIVARPLITEAGEFRGIVYVVLASAHFHQLFARLSLGEHGAIALRDDSMRLVARYASSEPGSTQGLGGVDVSDEMRRHFAASPDHGAYLIASPIDGVERMTAYRRVPGYPLTVLTGLSTRTHLARWRDDEHRQWFFTGAVILLMTGGFVYVLLQHRRLLRTNSYATRIAREQALVLDNDLIGMIRVTERRVVWANRAIRRILGHAIVGESTRAIYPDEATFEMVGRLGYEALARDGRFRTQVKMRRKDGNDIWVDLSGAALGDSESIWMVLDIDQLKNSEERAQYMALHDPLTGLANRRLFEELLRHSLAQARRQKEGLGVCYMDLDGFKPINDTHGHEAGDEVLREVGERLKHELRSNDSVSRLGGDEFAWVLTGMHAESDAVSALERCLRRIQQPIALDSGVTVSVNASIGLVLSWDHQRSAEELLAEADETMYRAKRTGRGHIEARVAGGP